VSKYLQYIGLLSILLFVSSCGLLSDRTSSATITLSTSPLGSNLYGVAFTSQNNGWAVGGNFYGIGSQGKSTASLESGIISHYDGTNWQKNGVREPLYAIAMNSADNGWAVGWHGFIVHYNGTGWAEITSPTTATLRSIVFVNANEGWAIGDSGTILHEVQGQWAIVNSPVSTNLRSLSMNNIDEGWAVGDSGTILHYNNKQWQSAFSPTTIDLLTIATVSPTEFWTSGGIETSTELVGNLFHYDNGNWDTAINTGNPSHAIAFTSAQNGWALGASSIH